MKMLQDGDGWDAQRRAVVYTVATLAASGAHGAEERVLRARLGRWDEVEAQRQAADDGLVVANARVTWCDEGLDEATATFSAQLLVDCNRDRTHPTYVRFFPASLTAITQKALDAQLRDMADFATLGDELSLTKASKRSLAAVLEAMEAGRAALDARATAEREVTRVSVAQAAWRDETNAVRREVDVALHAHANGANLPRSYAARFSRPVYEKPAKKKAAAPQQPKSGAAPAPVDPLAALAPHDQVLALSDAVLRGLAEDFVASLPTNVQVIVRARRAR